ncbi:MAG: WYL domain-containing protein [Planctomycetes bacterium]|nr:WYL domain-containing protein [Planctomycetota bacterium]
MDEVKKLLTIISYLKENPGTKYEELAELLGESEKEVRENIDKLLMCGVPPYFPTDYICIFDEGDALSIDFVEHFKRPVKLSPSENIALQMALAEFQTLNPESDEIILNLRKKLEKALPKSQNMKDFNYVVLKNKRNQSIQQRISMIKTAITDGNKIEIEYFQPSTRKFIIRTIRPYIILRIKDSLYLKGFCELRQNIRSFKIDRIKSIEMQNTKFEKLGVEELLKLTKKPINYIPPRLRSKMRTIKVKFSQSVAPYVLEEWGKKICTLQSDGKVIFETTILDDDWVVRYVLSFGKDACVIAPQDIVEKIKLLADNLVKFCC